MARKGNDTYMNGSGSVADQRFRQKAMAVFFKSFAKCVIPWIHEMTEEYLDAGTFPEMAAWTLPSCYTDSRDIEVAALVAMLVNGVGGDTCRALRMEMGESPWTWFKERWFVELAHGSNAMRKTGGVRNDRLYRTMDMLWNGRRREGRWILEGLPVPEGNAAMASLVLGTSDGFGLGIWDCDPSDVACPITADVKRFLSDFWPDYKLYKDIGGVIDCFGFKYRYHALYAALAWKEKCDERPRECSRLSSIYAKRYSEGTILPPEYWTGDRDGILFRIKSIGYGDEGNWAGPRDKRWNCRNKGRR